MPNRHKKILINFSYFFLILLPFLSACAVIDSLAQASDQPAPVVRKPAPSIQSTVAEPLTLPRPLPDRLQVPAIDLDTPVVELGWSTNQNDSGRVFSEWDVADNAAGWHKNSALPAEGNNVVMSGHNNIMGAVFRELDQLKRGDEAIVWSAGQPFRYRVAEVMIVPEKYATAAQRKANAAWIGRFDEERLTLVSCWPRDDNTHRIIVVAYPAPDGQQ